MIRLNIFIRKLDHKVLGVPGQRGTRQFSKNLARVGYYTETKLDLTFSLF